MSQTIHSPANLDWFWNSFDEIADAPNGVVKLRELILQLAVQGRLVPQDEHDEPASVLLERIAEDKARCLGEKRTRKSEPLPPINEDDVPFEIPTNWEWAPLGEVTDITRGVTFPSTAKTIASDPDAIACIRTSNVQESLELDDLLFIPRQFVKNPAQLLLPNDLVISMANSKELVGKIAITEQLTFPCTFGGFLSVIRVGALNPHYMHSMLRSPKILDSIRATASQTVNIANISLGSIRPLPIPIPPLAEQNRIVAKVDELMALCDEMETHQKRKREGRTLALKANLDRLTGAADADEFGTRLAALADHFDELLDAPESVAPLRAAILSLAVQGKLVPQDERDEPSSVLLEQIAAEKERLVKEKKIRKSEPLPPINEEDVPFDVPASWKWVRLGLLGEFYGGGTPSKSNLGYWDGNIPWVSPKDMKVPVIQDSQDHISTEAVEESAVKLIEAPAILFVLRGMILAHSFPIAITARSVTINQDMKALCLFVIDSIPYIALYFGGVKQHILNQVERSSHGTCRLDSEKLISMPIALPPLAEQKRIVAKVDELMALCDELEAGLRAHRSDAEALVEAVVRSMTQGSAQPAEEREMVSASPTSNGFVNGQAAFDFD